MDPSYESEEDGGEADDKRQGPLIFEVFLIQAFSIVLHFYTAFTK